MARWGMAMFVALALAGCGEEPQRGGPAGAGGEGGDTGGTGGTGGVVPAPEGVLELVPAETCLEFGAVVQGRAARHPLTLRNVGGGPLEVNGISLTAGSSLAFHSTRTGPLIIPIDDAATQEKENEVAVEIVFAPAGEQEGLQQGTLRIETGNPRSSAELCLVGFASRPLIECSARTIDFGSVVEGIPALRTVECTNAGIDDGSSTDDNLYVRDVVTRGASPAVFSAILRNPDGSLGPKAEGYGAGEGFSVDMTYVPEGVVDTLGSIVLLTNDPIRSEYKIDVSGRGVPHCEFEVLPPSLEFGIVDVGQSAEGEFVIRNLGEPECFVDQLRFSDDSDDAFSLSDGPVEHTVIPARGELRVRVKFSPLKHKDDPDTGSLEFLISDPARRQQRLSVHGHSVEPCLTIEPHVLEFGTVAAGCSTRERFVTIVNVCDTPATLTGIDVSSLSTHEFRVRRRPPGIDTTGVTIQPGGQVEFTMAYVPEEEGIDLGMVFVQTAEIAAPHMAVLEGSSAADAIQTDVFEQKDEPKLDVLFVVDTSSSMEEARDRLVESAEAFLDAADASQIDFQIGVTTTCIGTDGRLVPTDGSRPQVLTPTTPNLAQNLAANLDVGTCSDTLDLGLEAAYRTLSAPAIYTAHAGLVRPGAHLALVFLTNEQDQSPQTTTFYYNFFMSIKGFLNSNMFSGHAIVGDKYTGCSGNGTTASPGDRYIAIAEASSGSVLSVCADDYSSFMQSLGDGTFGLRTRFFVNNTPEDVNGDGLICDIDCDTSTRGPDEEIQVRVDGVLSTSVNAAGARVWKFDRANNVLEFEPAFVPEPGSRIEISYKVACMAP